MYRRRLLMRIPALAILTIVTVSAAAPAGAQTYDPAYPVCLQVYGRETNYIECAYTSLAQCAQSASGRPAMCVINPYPAVARVPAEPNYRRHRRVH
jgi:hypothetical protein